MGVIVGDMPQGRPRRVAPLDGAARLQRDPIGRMVAIIQMPRRPGEFVLAHTVQVLFSGQTLVGQINFVIVGSA